MGLDMYLKKTLYVDGFSMGDYMHVDSIVLKDPSIDLEAVTKLKGAAKLQPCIKQVGIYFKWYTIFEEVGYWRKANMIHEWFVDHVQGGEDECNPYLVSRSQILSLYERVKKVINKEERPEEALPTQDGFFFGSTDYDIWYYRELFDTEKLLKEILDQTDFDKEILVYQSSW